MSRPEESMRGPTWEERLFQVLYRMVQTIKIHQDNNELVQLCLTEFHSAISVLELEDDLTIQIFEGRFYIQGERLQYRKEIVRLIHFMLDFFRQRSLRGLRFNSGVKDASISELLLFVRHLIRSAEQEDPPAWLIRKMEEASLPWVGIIKGKRPRRRTLDSDLRNRVKTAYYHALSSVKEVSKKISLQGYAGVRKAKRMVQTMVDCVSEEESIFLALSAIKEYDDYTYTHSVNVAVLALGLGNRIGFSRISLEHLGICGLFHDLGKVEVPREIINKAKGLTEEEWEEVQKHPLASVKQILRLYAVHDLKSKVLLGPFEHHIRYDLTGYPALLFKKNISLFGRILQIADVYDAVTSPRAYRASALSPDQAIASMVQRAGSEFDPILIKVFATMMGTYPVGTLLQFDTEEIGLVRDYAGESGNKEPQILLLEKDSEGTLMRGQIVGLHEKDATTGTFRRNIVRSLNPTSLGIQTSNFL